MRASSCCAAAAGAAWPDGEPACAGVFGPAAAPEAPGAAKVSQPKVASTPPVTRIASSIDTGFGRRRGARWFADACSTAVSRLAVASSRVARHAWISSGATRAKNASRLRYRLVACGTLMNI